MAENIDEMPGWKRAMLEAQQPAAAAEPEAVVEEAVAEPEPEAVVEEPVAEPEPAVEEVAAEEPVAEEPAAEEPAAEEPVAEEPAEAEAPKDTRAFPTFSTAGAWLNPVAKVHGGGNSEMPTIIIAIAVLAIVLAACAAIISIL